MTMYFLEQVRKQFLSQVVNYAGIEGPKELQQDTNLKTPEAEKTPGEVLDIAKKTSGKLNDAVGREEDRGLISSLSSNSKEGETSRQGEKSETENNSKQKLISNLSPSDAEIQLARSEFPGEVSEEVVKEKILKMKLEAYNSGELPEEDKEQIEDIFTKAGLEKMPGEITVDALESGEVDDIGKDATPEQLASAENEVSGQVQQLDEQISSMPAGPEREVLEKRRGLLGIILDSLLGKVDQGGVDGKGFAGVESNGSHNVVGTAKRHLGIHENSGNADKFLMGLAQSARKTPWCAGFVSYVCKEAGYDINPTLSSKAFIGETGKGHVAFNIGDGKMLGGNQSNTVSIKSINKPVQGWIMPEDYAAGKPAEKNGKAPVGAIIVFDRGSSQKQWA